MAPEMKRSKISHSRLARNLGSRVSGHVRAGAGYFGALQLAEDVRRKFKATRDVAEAKTSATRKPD